LKSIIINTTTFRIPTSWLDVTLKHQLKVERLTIEYPDLKSMAIIAGYTDTPIDVIKHLHINEVKLLLDQLSFCSTPLDNKPIYEFELQDIKYKVLPTLLKAEFQDFLSIETILDTYKGKEYQALPYIIAVLAKRENETLDKLIYKNVRRYS